MCMCVCVCGCKSDDQPNRVKIKISQNQQNVYFATHTPRTHTTYRSHSRSTRYRNKISSSLKTFVCVRVYCAAWKEKKRWSELGDKLTKAIKIEHIENKNQILCIPNIAGRERERERERCFYMVPVKCKRYHHIGVPLKAHTEIDGEEKRKRKMSEFSFFLLFGVLCVR